MFLGDDSFNPFCLIIEGTPSKVFASSFMSELKLGRIIRVVNTVFAGYFDSMILLKCEGIASLSAFSSMSKDLALKSILDNKRILVLISD